MWTVGFCFLLFIQCRLRLDHCSGLRKHINGKKCPFWVQRMKANNMESIYDWIKAKSIPALIYIDLFTLQFHFILSFWIQSFSFSLYSSEIFSSNLLQSWPSNVYPNWFIISTHLSMKLLTMRLCVCVLFFYFGSINSC